MPKPEGHAHARLVYAPAYNIGFFGLEALHPFDSRKYGRAWNLLRTHFGESLIQRWIEPKGPVDVDDLLRVHSRDYLQRLRNSQYVAGAIEIPLVAPLPHALVDRCVLRPMRWAAQGSMLAAESAMEHGFAVNLGGGFHHAKSNDGEGFCVYSDIGLAVAHLRANDLLADTDPVAYIDLDAHQGNGVCHVFMHDRHVYIFDMYNGDIYPRGNSAASQRIDCELPLRSGCADKHYPNI